MKKTHFIATMTLAAICGFCALSACESKDASKTADTTTVTDTLKKDSTKLDTAKHIVAKDTVIGKDSSKRK